MGEKVLYDTIFARSFSRYDQKRLGYGAFLSCLLIAFSFCTLLKPSLSPIPILNKRVSNAGLRMLRIMDLGSIQKLKANDTANIVNHKSRLEIEMVVDNDTSSSNNTITQNSTTIYDKNSSSETEEINVVPEKMKPMCDTEGRTEICEMSGDIRVDGKSSTVFMAAVSPDQIVDNSSMIIHPYARKGDEEAMNRVTKWSIKSGLNGHGIPQCTQNHEIPGIVFSTGGYAGNNFHDFTDIVIPLYLTSKQFNGEVKFLITDMYPWWINKFKNALQNLSNYELIDMEKDPNIHCFQTLIVGLKRNPKELNIDPSKSPHYSMKDFRQFLRNAYSLPRETAIKMGEQGPPRLLIVSRTKTRAFTNINDIARMATTLGFTVTIAEANSDMANFSKTVNSCDVMMGVHGAGLTNMVFLPENAVLIQILPIGGFEWLARTDFGEPSKTMNLRYLDYKIKNEESTLIQQFPADDEVFRNPSAIEKKGWYAFKTVYLEKQSVQLDINRFRPTLLRALELLHQ